MALSIKIVTTNGVSRNFFQSNNKLIQEIIDSLKNNSHIFSSSSLIISSDLQTEIFSPKFIASIELSLDSEQELASEMQSGDMYFRAISSDNDAYAFDLDFELDADVSLEPAIIDRGRVEFYFLGGHSVTTEVILNRKDITITERTNRITQVFEQEIIYYQSENNGLGLFNPQAMTRAIITPRTYVTPSNTIMVDDY